MGREEMGMNKWGIRDDRGDGMIEFVTPGVTWVLSRDEAAKIGQMLIETGDGRKKLPERIYLHRDYLGAVCWQIEQDQGAVEYVRADTLGGCNHNGDEVRTEGGSDGVI